MKKKSTPAPCTCLVPVLEIAGGFRYSELSPLQSKILIEAKL